MEQENKAQQHNSTVTNSTCEANNKTGHNKRITQQNKSHGMPVTQHDRTKRYGTKRHKLLLYLKTEEKRPWLKKKRKALY